jgi:hypothetical protein
MRVSVGVVLATVLLSSAGIERAVASPITLYAGNGGHNDGTSVNDGWLVIINQTTAAVTPVGHPDAVARLSGLTFDSTGVLWASTLSPAFPFPPPPPATTSSLIRIDPSTGAELSSAPITLGGVPLSIADLADQPSTGKVYGVTGPNGPVPAELVTINPVTGAATLIGAIGSEPFASIAFTPSGTLYASLAAFDHGPINPVLATLDPLTAAILTSVPTEDFFGSLGIRPTDSVIFGGTGDTGDIFTISPSGAETLVGNTGLNFAGDLAFAPVPEPATFMLVGAGLAMLARRRQR